MYLLYVDESGTSAIPGNTSHFVLAGLSVPIWRWRLCDREINDIKKKYSLEHAEIHTAWILRKYIEQKKIPNFPALSFAERRYQVDRIRKAELLRLQSRGSRKHYNQTKKNYSKTTSYIHLTHDDRNRFIEEVAVCISSWGYARLFAECIDKIHFDPQRASTSIDHQAFEQIVSRFQQYLESISTPGNNCYGLLIHDNNDTVARKHTRLMQEFYEGGTLWTRINNIIETPLFVNSHLTSMVQLADLCSYALRRYLENGEADLFSHIFKRADRKYGLAVGVRHFGSSGCTCEICKSHTY